jgi:hypothetical protein
LRSLDRHIGEEEADSEEAQYAPIIDIADADDVPDDDISRSREESAYDDEIRRRLVRAVLH